MSAIDRMHIGIVSSERPDSVERMTEHMAGIPHAWYVPVGQGASYQTNGAPVVEVEGNLSDQRNAVLEAAFADNRTAVQFNDDLVRVEWTEDGQTKRASDVPDALERLDAALVATGYRFAGSATTTNLYFYREPIGDRHFIMAHLMMMRPCPDRFDRRMRLKEDYDFTVKQLYNYGGVARVNGLLTTFRHNEKKGGCGPYRTPEEEERHVQILLEKWPGVIRRNPRREHEVLIKWPPRHG